MGKKDYSEDAKNFFFNEQNKKKKKKLEEEYGMFHDMGDENAPPELINNFLDYVEKFEDAAKNAERKKLVEILGFPVFKKAGVLTPEELVSEIENVMEKYAEHNINIDIIEKDDVPAKVFYKFLTEELPEHETDFIQVEGMTTNYIYEEFHPNDKLDAKNTIEWFADHLYSDELREWVDTYLSKDGLTINGKKKSIREFVKEMLLLIPDAKKIIKKEIKFNGIELTGQPAKRGVVEAVFGICYKDTLKKKKSKELNLVFEIERSEYGGFNIKSCIIK